MKTSERVAVDAAALVSRLLLPNSIPGRAWFDRCVRLEDCQQFLRLLTRIAASIPAVAAVQAHRDPDDGKFLALAVNGKASAIVTGDDDLPILNPFQGSVTGTTEVRVEESTTLRL